jgi:deoxycytidylate deaminase
MYRLNLTPVGDPFKRKSARRPPPPWTICASFSRRNPPGDGRRPGLATDMFFLVRKLMPKNAPDNSNELMVAVVAAVGADIATVIDQIATELKGYGYESHELRLSDYLAEAAEADFRELPLDEMVWEAMTAGDELREKWKRNDALALHAISEIVLTREKAWEAVPPEEKEDWKDEQPPNLDRHAFIIRSLKTPDELETLRSVYGPRLVVIAAYSPRDLRVKDLEARIQASRKDAEKDAWAHQPEELIDRDEKEQQIRGQDVSGTFHRADFFIRGWNREVVLADLDRTFRIVFGDPFRTPTRDEYCQFMAAGASLRSAEFGRQVGAAVATGDGSVISLGTNEVPKARGGSCWEEEGEGKRDFEVGDIDTNRKHFNAMAERLSRQVDSRVESVIEGMPEEADREALNALRKTVVEALPGDLRTGGLNELTEFGRAAHAEMNALLDAARRGISVQDATLYTTTFPCHNCARHIIGAGVERVVFIEPYPKSRSEELHSDAVRFDGLEEEDDDRILFASFVGVAPRRYREMFDAAERERLGHIGRQDRDGHKKTFDKQVAVPIFIDSGLEQFRPVLREYRIKELVALKYFGEHEDQESIRLV